MFVSDDLKACAISPAFCVCSGIKQKKIESNNKTLCDLLIRTGNVRFNSVRYTRRSKEQGKKQRSLRDKFVKKREIVKKINESDGT